MTAASPDRRAIITEALRKIDDLSARLEVAEKVETEPIAVVGIGCRLPGGVNNADEFWTLLTDGASGVIRVPEDRWNADEYYSPDHTVPGTICNREGGFLTSWQPDEFDAEFFAISHREAAGMDPQQRLLLEVAWEALENAGINPRGLRGSATGVFVGMTTSDYYASFIGKLRPEEIDPYIPFGSAPNFAAGRLSYFLGVRGPAVVSDTACSSSLVSIHLACQSLRRGESDHALAAGVNLILTPQNNIACSRWGMLAPDGTCKTFDEDANGYVRSEGCGVVVLKRLTDAQRDGDRVLAVIRGSAVNQDGASSGQTVPNGPAQQVLMRRALETSRLAPADIDYIEAHGTGTALGDPIELDALNEVYGERDGSAPLVLGSVKTNLGHLESAAGVTGFIKTVLSVHHGHIPKQLYFKKLTPQACEGAKRFRIAAEPMNWPAVDRPRRAAVSSFGVSGTNAHVVIEQAPAAETAETVDAQPTPEPAVTTLVVTGKTPARIASTAAQLADWLAEPGAAHPLSAVAHTLNHHRAQHSKFATVAATDTAQAVAGLRALAGGYPAPGVVAPHDGICGTGTVFLYSGQGSQWAGMGKRLLADEPAFADAVAELDPVFTTQVGFSLREVLESGQAVEGIDRIQPVLVGVQLALTALWRSYGVVPDAVIGHSMGEVTAAVVGGALSPADGLKVIATRSRLMKRLSGQGAMALLELDADAAEKLIADYPGLTVAVYASPRQTVIAGPPDQVDAVIAVVDAQDKLARRVDVDVASHHPIIDPILDDLRAELAGLRPSAPSIPVIVTTDGRPTDGSNIFDAEHWVANLRNPVRFGRAVATAGADHATFVEVSPHPLLAYAVKETLVEHHHHCLGTLARDANDTLTFRTNLNAAHTIRPPKVPHPAQPWVPLPTTPWHHTRHWITPVADTDPAAAPAPHSAARNGADIASGSPAAQHHPWFHTLAWPARELPQGTDTDGASWLVIADPETGAELARTLGGNAQTLDPSTLADEAAAATLREALTGADRVVFAPPVRSARLDVAEGYALFRSLRALARSLSTLGADAPRLYVVTRNAQPLEEGDRANPVHAVLWGQVRTLAVENPEFWGAIIDVDESAPAELVARYLRSEAAAGEGDANRDDQAVYQGGVRHVPRLRRASMPATTLTRLEPDTSHLVIGATGNVGPYLIRQLAEMGAATVVAVSRRGSQLTELAAEVAAHGCSLVEVAADAADETAMRELFGRFGTDLPPLDGIYLAALSGGEALLTDMTDEDLSTMFRSKLDVTAVLHKLTLATPVRRFVLFSSITGILGSRAVSHYTAGNAFMDTLAYARRALGLAATVVDWGLWKTWADIHPALAAAGLEPMPNDAAIRMLPAVLSPEAGVHCAVVGADWGHLADAYRMRAPVRALDDVLAGPDADIGDLGDVAEPVYGTLLGEQEAGPGHQTVWRSRLLPEAQPYPHAHRVRGVEVVPVSVLLETLAAAAGALEAAAVTDVRFEYPIVAGQRRVVHVVADGGALTVSTSATADTPAERWTRHASARIVTEAPAPAGVSVGAIQGEGYDAAVIAELQHSWGIEGQPFDWTVGDSAAAGSAVRARITLPQADTTALTAALVDAAVHVARLADKDNPQLLLPAGVETLWADAAAAGTEVVVEALRRDSSDGTNDLVVDVTVRTLDGRPCVDVRGLTFSAVESTPVPAMDDTASAAAEFVDWSAMSAAERLEQLRTRLRAILARELGMPDTALDFDMPFPDLGMDSMMAMNLLRDAKALVRVDLSATMLWDNPTIASFAAHIAELITPEDEPDEELEEITDDSFSVLDSLFESVESASSGSESSI
ncbi:polyketide synthase [Mycolicibacterium duvalii]|uniref:Phthiocerol/phenolphthiocerol synthesis polyketide synthase type I PpsB n=1 Tax=Mycolicibacterium duvalii TaxID=39688 RepID=A0A7I7JXH2_9MYCO|nr:type I polyketide synthase [Mycolicibacterium duvalii]MCV7369725.1 type I polyketide synthase [Mycolicibacterium duvalii]PEG37991.1 polyketide synthase [Mycolicibacterium duvalii]BBX16453.1 phthiocerol/phenolphthiocerol synthesis polyketide synthase type I PpsB [Mycolicibacterium duvalii]